MRARNDESVICSYVSLTTFGCAGAFAGYVVATDAASVDADYDNGAGLRSSARSRGRDERAPGHLGARPASATLSEAVIVGAPFVLQR
jgi:hypothetical protein